MSVTVVDHDAQWANLFETLRSRILPVVADVAISIEHVGSTAVSGLPAKPVIDMDVVVLESNVRVAIEHLATLGYVHRGDLGIPDREAFHAPPDSPRHHLYLCPSNSLALRNHLVIRDCLRADPVKRNEYGLLKRRLAEQHRDDVDAYVAAKTEFLLAILRDHGFTDDSLECIRRANQGNPMPQSDLAIPILPSRSISATVAFYKKLGFEGGMHPFNNSYAILRRGTIEIHFFTHDGLVPCESSAGCYLRVQDVESVYRDFAANPLPKSGIPRMDALEDKPWGLREFAIVDPDGNLLRIGQTIEK